MLSAAFWILRGAGGIAAFTELLEQRLIAGDESLFLGPAPTFQL